LEFCFESWAKGYTFWPKDDSFFRQHQFGIMRCFHPGNEVTALARNTKVQRTGQQRIIQLNAARVQFDSTGTQEELKTQMRELAREIVSGLSALELDQSKELLGAFVSDLFLCVADRERQESRRQRQAEGIAAAKARGVRFGPGPKPLPENFDECHRKWRDGELSLYEAAEACGMPKTSFHDAVVRKERSMGCAI